VIFRPTREREMIAHNSCGSTRNIQKLQTFRNYMIGNGNARKKFLCPWATREKVGEFAY
jgi:hypothetical protein